MPKTEHDDVVDYWSKHEYEGGLSVDWAEAHERCWRCGYKSKLERCHIIPDSMGGPDTPSNLVLLCHRCHREAPNVSDARFMWIWLRVHGTELYDTFWTLRGFEEFEKMFKRKPFGTLRSAGFSEDEINCEVRSAMESATIHFGEGRMNPSTIACVLFLVEEQLLRKSQLAPDASPKSRDPESP